MTAAAALGAALSSEPLLSRLARAAPTVQDEIKMKLKDVFLLICTGKFYECRDFYVRHLNFTATFESSIYIQLHADGEGGPGFSLALMPPDNPFGPNFGSVFDGRGAYLTLEVADAAEVAARLTAEGAPIVQPVRDEGWGQRHVVTRDPHGTLIDIVQTIEAAPGYYDRYKPLR